MREREVASRDIKGSFPDPVDVVIELPESVFALPFVRARSWMLSDWLLWGSVARSAGAVRTESEARRSGRSERIPRPRDALSSAMSDLIFVLQKLFKSISDFNQNDGIMFVCMEVWCVKCQLRIQLLCGAFAAASAPSGAATSRDDRGSATRFARFVTVLVNFSESFVYDFFVNELCETLLVINLSEMNNWIVENENGTCQS